MNEIRLEHDMNEISPKTREELRRRCPTPEEVDALLDAHDERNRYRDWNERVSVCRDHTDDITDGPCVICQRDENDLRTQLQQAEARIWELEKTLTDARERLQKARTAFASIEDDLQASGEISVVGVWAAYQTAQVEKTACGSMVCDLRNGVPAKADPADHREVGELLPDCMMPDGAEPCEGYKALQRRLSQPADSEPAEGGSDDR